MINISKMDRAYSEVYEFMDALGEYYINQIPKTLYNTIKNNRDINYKPKYDKNQTLTEEDISKEALALIAALNLQYWCKDEAEKKRLKEVYINNTKIEKEKYSYENLFNHGNMQEKLKEENIDEENEHTELAIVEKKSFIFSVINKIRRFFSRIKW